MIIKNLYTGGFGKFHDQSIHFDPRLNVVYGNNEAGKSTLHTLIRALLFGIDKKRGRASKDDLYGRFMPWEGSGTYEGILRIQKDGKLYRIERKFHQSGKEFHLIDETNGREIENPEKEIDDLLSGMNEAVYSNTLSIGQLKSQTDAGLITELKNHIVNLHTSGSLSLDITKSSSYLKSEKKQQEALLHPNTRNEYESINQDISLLEIELARMPSLQKNILLKKEREEVKSSIEEATQKRQNLMPYVEKVKEVMSNYKFTTIDDLESFSQQFETQYTETNEMRRQWSSKANFRFLLLYFSVSLIAVAAAGYFYFLQQFGISGVLSAISIFAFIKGQLLLASQRKLKRNIQTNDKTLINTYARFLGDRNITDENYVSFYKKINDLRELFKKLESSDLLVKQYLEDVVRYQEKLHYITESLESLQKNEWETEKRQETLQRLYKKLEVLENQLEIDRQVSEEIASIELAQSVIEKLSVKIHNSFGIYLNRSASKYIQAITNGRYTNISVDESLNVFLNTPSKLVPLSHVSKGTIEQVYLALRLALIKFMWPNEKMPLILDDSFAFYDEDRLSNTLKFLNEYYDGQIIIFTCHKREGNLLKKLGIHYETILI